MTGTDPNTPVPPASPIPPPAPSPAPPGSAQSAPEPLAGAQRSPAATPASGPRQKERPLLPVWIGAAVLMIAALLGLWYASRPAPIPLQGTVEADEVNVATKAFARVETLNVREGDLVQAGQVLATLSSPALDLGVNQAEASLDTARALDAIASAGSRAEDVASLRGIAASSRAAADLAAVTARRMQRLHAEGVVSTQRRDEANAARVASAQNAAAADAQYRKALAGRREETRDIADTRAEAAQRRLDSVREMEREKVLVAPIAGEVARRLVQPGEVVAPAIPVLQLLDVAHPHVNLRVPETRYDGMAIGRTLTGSVPALSNRSLRFKVSAISADAGFTSERATRQSAGFDARSFRVTLEPVEAADALRPGMSVLFDWPQ